MKSSKSNLLGIAVGVSLAFILPTTGTVTDVLAEISDIILSLGRYFLLPLIFFSLPVAVTRLRRLSRLGRLMSQTALSILISSAALTIIGTAVTVAIQFGRVPAIPGSSPAVNVATLGEIVQSILQFEGFRETGPEGKFLLPLIIPAFILGWHFHHDREIAEPSYNFFDSMSRIIYRANRYLLKLMPGLLAVLSAYSVLALRNVEDFRRFLPFLYLLVGLSTALILVVYPFLLWLFNGRRSPWPTLAGLSGALLGAFVSASPLFNYGNLTAHLKENLRLPRHTAALIAPIYLMFARAGTAMVTAMCMITIVQSYSSLEITLFQMAWTALFSFLIAFVLPAAPDRGLISALVLLGNLYGRGLNDGWLILVPILPLLMMISAVLDTATTGIMLVIVSRRNGLSAEEG